MNLTLTEATSLAIDVMRELVDKTPKDVQLILCPPFPFIQAVADKVTGHAAVSVGAQNCASENSGAFTGEVSARMIESMVARYVIIGHSERRALYFETDEVLVKKLEQVLANNLTPIFCCGETLAERESGKHFEIIKSQIAKGLFHLNADSFSKVVLAYEPVWAIGTGVTASSAQAQEVHQAALEPAGVEEARHASRARAPARQAHARARRGSLLHDRREVAKCRPARGGAEPHVALRPRSLHRARPDRAARRARGPRRSFGRRPRSMSNSLQPARTSSREEL